LRKISVPIAGVVADANVLLSAIVGKSALRVFTEFAIQVHATRFNADEVSEYLPEMAAKYRLPVHLVQLQWKLLPVRLHREEDYKPYLSEAVSELKDRDPEDAHVLALAKSQGLPMWSNDRDLAKVTVECLTTAKLLRILQDQPTGFSGGRR
jgi:predicted nucleic acid-binding protein